MRIAVIGGGTAGFVAAAHLTKKVSDARLLHIYDSGLPTIGVGEGTTPRFPGWFEDVTGLGFVDLETRCRATLKRGTRYEGWGFTGVPFRNMFQPAHLVGYHFDATDVARLLEEHVVAERIDTRVRDVIPGATGASVRMADGTEHLCDYVFDARGFPRREGAATAAADTMEMDWVPTNRAILRRLGPGVPSLTSDAIARPHGWIFRVPLQGSTSCGYVFRSQLSSDVEVEADFDDFLRDQGVASWEPRKAIDFPNFTVRRWFDGRVFRVGNVASFVEPLEATAIGTAIVQVRTATDWILEHGSGSPGDPDEAEALNDSILSYVMRNSLFIAWHYACGSCWDTPFWSYARRGLDRARAHDVARAHLEAMEEFVEAGRSLPGPAISDVEDVDRWEHEVLPLLKLFRPFGNFSELNFAQVGHGIGLYDVRSATGPIAALGADR